MAKDAEYKPDARDGDGDGFVQDGTIWERPVGTQDEGFKEDAIDGDGDGFVQDATPFEREAEEVEPEPEPEKEEKKATPKKATPKSKKVVDPKSVPTVLTSGDRVSRAKLQYKNVFEHNSYSVVVTQTRLVELGYAEAGADKRGYFGDGTLTAISKFAKDQGLGQVDIQDEALVKAIFAGTPVTIGL